jgi:hypothetical protein
MAEWEMHHKQTDLTSTVMVSKSNRVMLITAEIIQVLRVRELFIDKHVYFSMRMRLVRHDLRKHWPGTWDSEMQHMITSTL